MDVTTEVLPLRFVIQMHVRKKLQVSILTGQEFKEVLLHWMNNCV